MTTKWMGRGILAFGGFLCFAATMAGFAGITLVWPGTALDVAWRLNPKAHKEMASYGWPIGVGFLLLSTAFVEAAIGWFRRRTWGRQLAVTLIAIQFVGDVINLLRGQIPQGVTGVLAAAALLAFLLNARTRAEFQ